MQFEIFALDEDVGVIGTLRGIQETIEEQGNGTCTESRVTDGVVFAFDLQEPYQLNLRLESQV